MQTRSFRSRGGARPTGRKFTPNRRPSNKRSGQRIDVERFVKKAKMGTEVTAYIAKNTFKDFGLHPTLQSNVDRQGYTEPSPIQDQSIPHVLDGRDLIGIANTGTGKTAAFLLPLINKIANDPNQKALIIAPTRELALQISNEFRNFSEGMRQYATLCIGGTPIGKQMAQLSRNPHLVIGTPGRLKDLVQRRKLYLADYQNVVLDEVDRMVDMGFINDIRFLIAELPTDRQSLFLSATISPQIDNLIKSFLREPVTVSVRSAESSDNVEQDVVRVAYGQDKIDVLHKVLAQEDVKKVLIFGQTKHGVERLSVNLNDRGFKVAAIHGDKSQSQRQRALQQFRDDLVTIMVATDVAARGLDIKDVTHVVNYDLPQTYDDYIHRIGRTGRAGQKGYALTFVG